MSSALFIGRFQPFHLGHLDIIKKILKENDKVVIGIGSSRKHGTSINPLTAIKRRKLIEESLEEADIPKEKYEIREIPDIDNFSAWADHVKSLTPPFEKVYTGSEMVSVCFEGDLPVIPIIKELKICATDIREAIRDDKEWENLVPKAVENLLKKWDAVSRIKKLTI